MKTRIVALLLLALIAPAFAGAEDDAESYFNKGLEHLVRQGYMGDTSAAQRYLSAALEKDPKHVEALWLLLVTRMPSKNAPLVERERQTARRNGGEHGASPLDSSNKTLEDSVKDLLRPMLKQWLDENMPRVLTAALKDELGDSGPRRQGD